MTASSLVRIALMTVAIPAVDDVPNWMYWITGVRTGISDSAAFTAALSGMIWCKTSIACGVRFSSSLNTEPTFSGVGSVIAFP